MELLASAVLGVVASYLQGRDFNGLVSDRANFLIALLSAVFMGAMATFWHVFTEGTYDPANILTYTGMAFSTSQIYFNMYLKPKSK